MADYVLECRVPNARTKDVYNYYVGLTHLLKAHPMLIDVQVPPTHARAPV